MILCNNYNLNYTSKINSLIIEPTKHKYEYYKDNRNGKMVFLDPNKLFYKDISDIHNYNSFGKKINKNNKMKINKINEIHKHISFLKKVT